MEESKKRKIKRKLINFIKSEKGGISKGKVIKIGGLTLGLLGGIMGADVFARSHTNTVDMVFDPTAPGRLGTHTNTVSWSWGNTWAAWDDGCGAGCCCCCV
ncbi:MAG: hypothetical protein HY811_00085 [Planctomycetes bacterium]|nr:hypothetical protein [Planctomycetota bacterium]